MLIDHLKWWTEKGNFFKGVPLNLTESQVLRTGASKGLVCNSGIPSKTGSVGPKSEHHK